MADGFDTLVPEARRFLSALSENNTRDWFLSNKDTYDTRLKSPALALIDVVSADLKRITGRETGSKLFRPHRDVRFSKDKTPYHTHLHMLWTTGSIGWFLGIAPGYVSVGAGRMALAKEALTSWRALVDGPDGDGLGQEIGALVAGGMRLGDPELKRVPAPYDSTHPRADLLRRKSITLWQDLEGDVPDLVDQTVAAFARLHPFTERLQDLPD